jgi:pullulanase
MVKKDIVDSVNYWADEYHIDGFRFDLVGLIDTETINEVINTVHEKHPNVIFYGEGWTMSTDVTKDGYLMTTQTNSKLVPGMAFFSDDMRDALKGSVFSTTSLGYVSGLTGVSDKIASYFTASTNWSKEPTQIVQYASCHDNNTLIDRITSSRPNATREEQIAMNNLAAAIYLTSQGIPFMQAGEEMLRSKTNADGTFNSNSYNAPDKVNQLKWSNLDSPEYMSTFEYYKGLIAFRKAHSALRMSSRDDINANIKRIEGTDENVVAMEIAGKANNDISDGIIVIFNPNNEETAVSLPDGKWSICINKEKAGTEVLGEAKESVTVPAVSAMVLVKGNVNADKKGVSGLKIALFALCGAALIGIGYFLGKQIKKKKEK